MKLNDRLRPSREWMLPSKFILLAAIICTVDANIPSDHHHNNNNNPRFNDQSSLSSIQPQQHATFNQHLDFDLTANNLSLSSETDFLAFYSDKTQQDGVNTCDRSKEEIPTGPLVASSTWTMYDTGCSVTSEALMCHGGDSMLIFPITEDVRKNHEEFDDEEHDDDDNDDDGHSSMLSNASLRRHTRIFSTVATISQKNERDHSSAASESSSTRVGSFSSLLSIVRLNESSRPRWTSLTRNQLPRKLTAQLLRLRGGGAGVASTTSSLGSEFAKKLFVAALVTLIYEAVLGHILEFVKIVMQTSPPHTSYRDVIHSITSEKGLAGLWDGFCPWGILQAIFKGGIFGLAHAMATKLLQPLIQKGFLTTPAAATLAGGLAGGCQGFVLSPTLLLKTRVMTNPVFREPMSLLQTTWMSARIGWDVVHVEGFSALMKGANIFALKRVFDWATRFLFSDLLESWFLTLKSGMALSAPEKSLASFLGGTASTLSTLPLDVLVAKTQDAKRAGVKVSAVKLFQDDLNEGGWSGVRDNYLRGFGVRLAHVCLTTVVMKTGSPLVYDALFGKSS